MVPVVRSCVGGVLAILTDDDIRFTEIDAGLAKLRRRERLHGTTQYPCSMHNRHKPSDRSQKTPHRFQASPRSLFWWAACYDSIEYWRPSHHGARGRSPQGAESCDSTADCRPIQSYRRKVRVLNTPRPRRMVLVGVPRSRGKRH